MIDSQGTPCLLFYQNVSNKQRRPHFLWARFESQDSIQVELFPSLMSRNLSALYNDSVRRFLGQEQARSQRTLPVNEA